MINPIALSIPAFFVLIGVELAWSWRAGRLSGARPTYRLVDAVTDLACGVSSQATGLLLSTVFFAGTYSLAWTHLRLWTLPDSLPVWLLTFVLVDLAYYLWHRASHRVNLLWAAHVVHHQSEDYNLAVALRQAIFTPLTSIPFYLPFALVGVSPLVLLTCSALNTLYQFWIHTRLVGRLGPLEWVMNTPSHHRVHHGINPGYIDKNHAGVFIVWDRLLGTFVPEGEEPVYGTVEGHRGADAIQANLAPWSKLWDQVRLARGWDRLRVVVAPPEWRPADQGGAVQIPEPAGALRWDPAVPPWLQGYALLWLVACTGALTWLLFAQAGLPWTVQAVLAGVVLWAIRAWGGLIDGRPAALAEEGLRLGATPVLAAWIHPLAGLGALALSLASGALLWRGRAAA
ncbi:sterol desaturase family protein [Myxococcota bacterium]|nr:sterol desaturase family protein [Myxococcota bacterium]